MAEDGKCLLTYGVRYVFEEHCTGAENGRRDKFLVWVVGVGLEPVGLEVELRETHCE